MFPPACSAGGNENRSAIPSLGASITPVFFILGEQSDNEAVAEKQHSLQID
jgi:hypothetical protein